MRINEAYEHEPIAPYPPNEACTRGCDKTVLQCTDVSAYATLRPVATIGTVVATCQGTPTVTCTTDASGAFCTLVMTQQVCLSIPVRYSVEFTSSDPTIACAGDGCVTGDEGCNCAK